MKASSLEAGLWDTRLGNETTKVMLQGATYKCVGNPYVEGLRELTVQGKDQLSLGYFRPDTGITIQI